MIKRESFENIDELNIFIVENKILKENIFLIAEFNFKYTLFYWVELN